MPSVQLTRFLELRASGVAVAEAATLAGIPANEAAMHEAEIQRGEIDLAQFAPRARAHTREEAPTGGNDMARDNEAIRHTGTVAADELRLLIERIERLAEERKGIADDIADVYGEAKARGYDNATIKRVVRLRAMDANKRQEAAALLETYASAVGLQDALPL